MHRSLRSLVPSLAVVTAATVLLVPAGSAVGATCANGMRTEAGTCARPVATKPLTQAQKKQRDRLRREYARDVAWLRGSARAAILPKDPPPPPRKYVLPEVEKMRIFREGEGNGKKYWTCGPSATRNVIAALYKRRTGRYRDLTEQYFERIEGTRRVGTARDNIADALNTNLPRLGHWSSLRPRNQDEYLGWVMANTLLLGRAVIANVDTDELGFWTGRNRGHFNFVYGYDARTRTLRVGEEFDSTYLFGTAKRDNPYGKHSIPLRKAFAAINDSPIHGIVA